MKNDSQIKQVIHFITKNPKSLILYIFFKVKWIDRETESGYFLVKRKWFWFVILPIILLYNISKCIIGSIIDIFSYDVCWIEGKNKKLTFIEKLYLGDRLIH